ncbi:KUP/HAK/KT family potassium transporter, partial [Mesorhizobium sp. M2A.F.Ca.ET.039.01.1.1]
MVLANASETESLERSGHAETERQHSTKVLMLGALGVVYGDIGTSPIYAFREALHASSSSVARNDVLGVLSLIVWALTIIVTVKY